MASLATVSFPFSLHECSIIFFHVALLEEEPLHAPMPQTLTRYTVSPIENDANKIYFWCHAPSSCTQTKASLIGTSTRKQTKALRCHGQMQPELMIQHCFGRYRLFFFSFPHCMCFVPPPSRIYRLNLSTREERDVMKCSE